MTTTDAMDTDGPASTAAPSNVPAPPRLPEAVVVHPLVLLSVVDHYHRVARDTRKRVVGCLLGEVSRGRVEVTNSFAVPFEEDDKDAKIWFLDHSYLEAMYAMFKKVNARERIVGWYSTGPRLRPADADIHDLVSGYVGGAGEAVALICEVTPKEQGLPVCAYAAVDEAPAGGGAAASGPPRRVFVNVPTEVGATEAEEVGVEHLLRDVKDAAASRLGADLAGAAAGVRGLAGRLRAVAAYAAAVAEGRLPPNHELLADIQSALSLLPSLAGLEGASGGGAGGEATPSGGAASLPPPTASLPAALSSRSTDMMLAVYAGAAVRAVLALHALVDNREAAAAREREAGAKAAVAAAGAKPAGGGGGGGGGKENAEAAAKGGGDAKAGEEATGGK